jgi:hypothetical protein
MCLEFIHKNLFLQSISRRENGREFFWNSFPPVYESGPLDCSHSELTSKNLILRDNWQYFFDGESARHKASI